MDPPIQESVQLIQRSTWKLGTSRVVKRMQEVRSEDEALACWNADDCDYFVLLHSSFDNDTTTSRTPDNPDLEVIHEIQPCVSVWRLGRAIIKVHPWVDGVELESNTIDFVKRHSSVPVPHVICSWVDQEIQRSFLIEEVVEGKMLGRAWPFLTPSQRSDLAQAVAGYCAELASLRSTRIESCSGASIFEPWLDVKRDINRPPYDFQLMGPFSPLELKSFLLARGTIDETEIEHIKIDEEFCFIHADLAPTNNMVSDDGIVQSIIDWDSGAFYPRFWIGTKPGISGAYLLQGEEICDPTEWGQLFYDVLSAHGYESDWEPYGWWLQALGKNELCSEVRERIVDGEEGSSDDTEEKG